MPYFSWYGVDCGGGDKRGKNFAASSSTLDSELFKRGIALLTAKPISISWFVPSIGTSDIAHFFKQLSVLVDAGILLTDALELVIYQVTNVRLQELICVMAGRVTEGISLSAALEQYAWVFDRMVIAQVRVAEESGTLSQVLQAISQMYQVRVDLRKKMKAALLLPCVTLLFFCAVIVCMFVVILPRFADLFKSYNQELPFMTRSLISMSEWCSSWYCVGGILILLGVGFLLFQWARSTQAKPVIDRWIIRAPMVGSIVSEMHQASFFQGLAQLLDGGLRVVPAVQLMVRQMHNGIVKEYYIHVEQVLQEGGSLSHALMTCPDDFFSPEAIALVTVGQESGRLAELSACIADRYHDQVLERLTMYANLIQPVCMILLGLLVTILVFAVYGPIFNMANMVNV